MKVVQINVTSGQGSTGKICGILSSMLSDRGIENYILCTDNAIGHPLAMSCAGSTYTKMQALKARILGNWGFNSRSATKRMIDALERIQPDAVYLHNLHAHNCHLDMLFGYLRQKKIKLFWVFHDCWAFTGYCMHFSMVKCEGWRTGCGNCPQKRQSSWFLDRSSEMLRRKKAMVMDLDLTVITPSRWLGELASQSFFSEFPVKVLYSGIDLRIFRPRESDFRRKYGLEDRFIILGVAFGWGRRKGLDVFCRLAEMLDERYQIVLVGTDSQVDKILPTNILSIHRTANQRELAQIYSAADVFANPTREEVLGLVNIEALACGTPVVTFRSGGSPECVDAWCGAVVDCDDVDSLAKEIVRICETKPFFPRMCLDRAREFDCNERYRAYIDLL